MRNTWPSRLISQRAIDIVAEGGGLEEGLFAIFPIVHRRALGRRQAAVVDQAARSQIVDGGIDGVGMPLMQRPFREEDGMLDSERLQILRIIAIIASIAKARTVGSHSLSGCSSMARPCALASASPTDGFR